MPKANNLDIERQHYETLDALAEHQWRIKYLYDRLNIVDSKTSALMRVNGVMMGFVTVAVFRVADPNSDLVPYPGLFLALCAAIFLLLFIAEFYSFSIFYLRFDRIKDTKDIERYKDVFFDITLTRERKFRRLRNLSFAGAFLFSALFFFTTLYQSLQIFFPNTVSKINIDNSIKSLLSMLGL